MIKILDKLFLFVTAILIAVAIYLAMGVFAFWMLSLAFGFEFSVRSGLLFGMAIILLTRTVNITWGD